jgi:hypothetical protein
MTSTPPGPLARTNYLNSPPGPYQPEADPNSPAFDPTNVLPHAGFANAALDAEQYYRPLERLHGAGLHGAGVAYGMQVSATIGQPNVTVMPGLALDPQGRHIYLGIGGSAEVGPSADVPNTLPELAPVTALGAVLPTAGLSAGTYYAVAQWRETWDAPGSGSNPNTNFYTDTPWLRLVTGTGYQPELHVILGQLVLIVSGGVTAVQSAGLGTAGGLQRTSVSLPAQALNLRRAVTTATAGADTVPWGAVRARESGGVEIAVAKGSDEVVLLNDGGGNFSTLAVGANQAVFGNAASPSINLDSAAATIYVGGHGQRGEVVVHDIANHAAITLAGDTGHVVVGGTSMDGQVRMVNHLAADTMRLDGSTGAAVVQRVTAFASTNPVANQNPIDVDGILKVHGGVQLDPGVTVTDGGGIPLMASPTRKVRIAFLGVGSGAYAESDFPSSATVEVPIPLEPGMTDTLFTAFTFITYIQSYAEQEYGDFVYNPTAVAEVYAVNGIPTDVAISGGPTGDTQGPYWFGGTGHTLTFRLRATDDSIEVYAAIVVFYE